MRTSRPRVGEGLGRARAFRWRGRELHANRKGAVGAHWIALGLGVVLMLTGLLLILVGGGFTNLAAVYLLLLGVVLLVVGVVADFYVGERTGHRSRA